MSSYSKTKNTKRFAFQIDRDPVAKKAGSNTLTIATQPIDGGQYSGGQSSLVMSVKEATALQGFLNTTLGVQV